MKIFKKGAKVETLEITESGEEYWGKGWTIKKIGIDCYLLKNAENTLTHHPIKYNNSIREINQ